MNINGILSIIVALAMMLSGGFNAEQPEALSARTLTLREVTISMGENAVQLTPSISMGAMSENGEAVLDFHIETEEGQIFPVQLAVDEENATLSLVNSGKSFSISNDTLMKVLKEMGVDLSEIQDFNLEKTLEKLYQDMIADMDEDEKEIFDHLFKDLLPKGVEMLEYLADPANEAQIKADMEGVKQEMRAMGGEGVPGIVEHNDKEYNVTTYEYTLDYDALMAMADKVYTANEKVREFYDSYFALMNLLIDQQNRAIESINMQMMEDMSVAEADAAVAAPESAPVQHYDFGQSSLSVLRPVSAMVEVETPVPAPAAISTPEPSLMPTFAPIESFADVYAMLDMDIDMTMECVETVSDDGEYVQADVVMRLSFPELEEPVEYTVSSLQVGDEIMAAMDMSFEQDGQYVNMECAAYQAEGENQFGFTMEMGEMEEDYEIDEATGESELVTTMETLMGVSVSLESALNPETGKTEYFGGFAVESDDVQAVLSADGEADEAGNSITEVVAGYAEDDVENYISFILEVSAEPFENFAADMDNTEITSGLIDIFTGKAPAASNGIIGGADGSTAIYTTDPGISYNEGGSSFGNLQPGATPEPTLSPEQQAMEDLQADMEAVAASFQKDAIALMADESVKDVVSLITLGYIYEESAEEVSGIEE